MEGIFPCQKSILNDFTRCDIRFRISRPGVFGRDPDIEGHGSESVKSVSEKSVSIWVAV